MTRAEYLETWTIEREGEVYYLRDYTGAIQADFLAYPTLEQITAALLSNWTRA